MVGQPLTLIITGGTSGIGAEMVRMAQTRGYQVAFAGSRPAAELPDDLRELTVSTFGQVYYCQANVRKADDLACFRQQVSTWFRPVGNRLVVASAGVSKRKGADEIDRMVAINVGGTQNLLDAFRPDLDSFPENRFVGLGSIVAAEGMSVRGDEAYQETKQRIAAIAKRYEFGFVLVPGAVDTAMTRQELVFGMLMVGALTKLSTDPVLRGGFGVFADGEDKLGSTPADALKGILGEVLVASDGFKGVGRVLDRDPVLAQGSSRLVLAKNLMADSAIQNRVVSALTYLDIVIPPDVVAKRLLDQFESGRMPPDRTLRVYSRHGENRILGLLSAAG